MKKIIFILLTIFIINACDVNVDNPNTITTATFWKTEADAQYGLTLFTICFTNPEHTADGYGFVWILLQMKVLARALGQN